MRVVILSARTGWHTDELRRALAARGHTATLVPYEGLIARLGGVPTHASDPPQRSSESPALCSEGTSLLAADVVLARIIPNGSLEQIIYRLDALHWIERRGIPVVNTPRAIERCVDKFYTDALLHEAGLRTPRTIVCERAADAIEAVRTFGDAVIKPIFGSMGHGMVRVDDPEVAFRVTRPLEQMRAVFYVQEAIQHDGRDIRAFVVGGRVLGAIERQAPPGEWRANVARGASARAIELPAECAQVALQATAAVGADYAGVDLLVSRSGELFVLEVNGIPGWQGLQRATGIDVAAALVAHVERCVARRTRTPAVLA